MATLNDFTFGKEPTNTDYYSQLYKEGEESDYPNFEGMGFSDDLLDTKTTLRACLRYNRKDRLSAKDLLSQLYSRYFEVNSTKAKKMFTKHKAYLVKLRKQLNTDQLIAVQDFLNHVELLINQ
jgi:serine/threonine protein kinase